MTLCRPARAVLSVSDKNGLVGLARELARRGVALLSTGGSAATLREAGLPVEDISAYTGFPEMMDGRVKTLHPKVHGGLLQVRGNATHEAEAAKSEIPPIDLLVVNLYPFRATVAQGADAATCIENIDIGGPAMIRSAAKNHAGVAVLTDPAQYDDLLAELDAHNGATTLPFRQRLAAAAFAHTARYDSAIATWFATQQGETFPETLTVTAQLRQRLRYGENPHQTAAFYVTDPAEGLAKAVQAQGKELSYNNIADASAALSLVSEFPDKPAVTIIKHANPSGVATGPDLLTAYRRALATDPVSAFGGIIACSQPLDGPTARAIAERFVEVVIAPDAEDEAVAALAAKPNVRLLLTRTLANRAASGVTVRSVLGGYLAQTRDALVGDPSTFKVVTRRAPTDAEREDLLFAFTVAKHVKSNAIVYAKDGATVGIGAGQMSRLDSSRIAVLKAQDAARTANLSGNPLAGTAVASDAYFPFADGLIAALEAGATSVIQPGGSIRDAEVIEAADKAGVAMLFTGLRHFAH